MSDSVSDAANNTAHDPVVVRRDRDAVWIGIDRPGKRNALDAATSAALASAVERAAAHGPAVLVLHSTTPGMFVAGTDIADLARRGTEEAMTPVNVRLFAQIDAYRWPTVAVVDGPALGGGCELALACDFRVASPRARFGQPEPALGLLAGAGGNWRLPDLVGAQTARRMLLAGDVLDGPTAEAAGLVDRLVPAEGLQAAAGELVAAIAARSWLSLELTKMALRQRRPDTTAFDLVAQALLYASPDSAERLGAFLRRRSRPTG